MRFRILGSLEVSDGKDEPVFLRARKQRTLLAILLLNANQPVSTGRIEAALWPGRPPRSAAAVIRTYVSGLRRMLHLGERGRLPRLATEPGGYRLLLGPEDLDLTVFDDLCSRGRRALEEGDAPQAARLLSSALTLWRGEPAGDIPLEGDSSAILAGLAERRLVAEESWADAQLKLGSGKDLIAALRRMAAGQPLRERTSQQLMLALHQSGRTAEALEAFRTLRGRMVTDLGIEPSAPVQELHQQILEGAPSLVPVAPVIVPRQLPRDIGEFTGRGTELNSMEALLFVTSMASPAIAFLTGTAGVGKTALAVHFAHKVVGRFPDGHLFIDLRGHADAEPMESAEALRRFLGALGIREAPGDTDEAAALYRSLLVGKRMIIVLDNAATASQIRPLLPGTPGCPVLVTSRSRLPGLVARDGAKAVIVGPLAESEGVILLRRILGDARVNAEPAAAVAIVARCARLPLALRVAAERAAYRPRRPLAELAGELAERHRLDVLTVAEDGHATVRSVFSWSCLGLGTEAIRMFRLIGLHPGPDIGVPAAAALTGSTLRDAARSLETLADVHLLDETAPSRYQAHDLLRTYAAERAAADETPASRAAAVRRVLTWYLYTADQADRILMPARHHVDLAELAPLPGEPLTFRGYNEALAWCGAEHANLIAAIQAAAEAGEDDIAWKLPVALWSYFTLRKPWADWIKTGQVAAAAARRAGHREGEACVLRGLSGPFCGLGRFGEALACLRRSLRICRETGDRLAEGMTLNNIGAVYGDLGRFEDAIECFRAALRLASHTGYRRGQAMALNNIGAAYHKLSRHGEAMLCFWQALQIARETGDVRIQGQALSDLGDAELALGKPATAQARLGQALAAWQRAGDRQGEAETRCKLGDLLSATGDTEAAREQWRQALAIFEELDDPRATQLRRQT
jgi:DNA-binding SARP family transcriptional activator/tetratricopeptide (TPR) repeat protein